MRSFRFPDRRFRHIFSVIALASLVLFASLVVLPVDALAIDYTIDKVDISATVLEDGKIAVVEQRTFDFDDDANGVYWLLPQGDYSGQTVGIKVNGVGVVSDGSVTEFKKSDSGQNQTYQLSMEGNNLKVKVYNKVDASVNGGVTTVQLSYTISNLIVAHKDVAELYWKFVSDGWDVTSNDVTATITLPVPSGQTVEPGVNVRAWGHGTLDGTVEFDGDSVVYTVPKVGSDDYAEARIIFPISWTSLTPGTDDATEDIVAEETAWADQANDEREFARRVIVTSILVVSVPVIACALLTFWSRRRYVKTHQPSFHDEYWRDVPSDDHPAVIATLASNTRPDSKEFSATLMRLTDMHVISLEAVDRIKTGKRGVKTKPDYKIVRNKKKADSLVDPIDTSVMDLLFGIVALKAKKYSPDLGDEDAFYVSDMKRVAKKSPATYSEGVEDFVASVEAVIETRGFKSDPRRTYKAWPVFSIIVSVLGFSTTVVIVGIVYESWVACLVLTAACMALLLYASYVIIKNRKISPEAQDIIAKTNALKHWIEDFTNLNEAVPQDVILWNKILVLAVALGVADKVIEILKVNMPEVLDDPGFYPMYMWYYGSPGRGPAMDVVQSTYTASMQSVASSLDSSGGGGGGGFSGGGGGGFGGGGGGGAF